MGTYRDIPLRSQLRTLSSYCQDVVPSKTLTRIRTFRSQMRNLSVALAILLAGCATTSGSYSASAYDSEGKLLTGKRQLIARVAAYIPSETVFV